MSGNTFISPPAPVPPPPPPHTHTHNGLYYTVVSLFEGDDGGAGHSGGGGGGCARDTTSPLLHKGWP